MRRPLLFRRWLCRCLLLGGLGVCSPMLSSASAVGIAGEEQPPGPFGAQILALESTVLDEVRGGFEPAGSHFSLSFGIERSVYINGELVATTVFNLKDLQLSGGAGANTVADLPAASFGALGIIQNGAGNDVSTRISAGLAGTIIQNTLNDQKIQNLTTINATVNSLQVMRAISVQTAVQDGIVNSLRR